MGFSVLFAIMAVVVLAVGFFHPRAATTPMFRIGSYFVGAALAVLAVSVLLTT